MKSYVVEAWDWLIRELIDNKHATQISKINILWHLVAKISGVNSPVSEREIKIKDPYLIGFFIQCGKNISNVQAALVICGLFICDFAYMWSRNGLFSGTYPLIYSHPWSFCMRIHYMQANFLESLSLAYNEVHLYLEIDGIATVHYFLSIRGVYSRYVRFIHLLIFFVFCINWLNLSYLNKCFTSFLDVKL
jgi:hypothetical protein